MEQDRVGVGVGRLLEHSEQAVLFPTTGNPVPDHSRHPGFQNKTLMCHPLGLKIDPEKKKYEKTLGGVW